MLEIIKQLNWIDILIVIILIRTSCIAINKGLFVEFFKFFGVISGIYISLHYYAISADFLDKIIKTKAVGVELLDFLALVSLAVLGYIFSVLLRESFARFIKTEVLSALDKWGAAILGVLRGVLLAGLFMYIFSLPVISYLKNSVHNSYWGSRIVKVPIATYSGIWNNFMSKFMPQEKFNKAVLDIQEEYRK